MRFIDKAVCRIFCSVFFVLVVIFLAGCNITPVKSSPMQTYCQPELPFLLGQPYSRLYVEVDRTENVEIPEGVLDELEEFLGKYCNKPDGIEIVIDDVIPNSEYKERSAELVGNLFIDGPAVGNDDKTAYLYVFFYDSSKMGEQPYCRTPHVNHAYPSAIFYDIDFARIIKDRFARSMMLHETGHVLGLCKNTEHGDGGHCANDGCIMSKIMVSISKVILGLPLEKLDLCTDCQNDLKMLQTENQAGKMSFNGPFLVRQEDGYWVASLPVSDLVSFTGTDTFDWQETLGIFKQYVKNYEKPLQEDLNSRLHHLMAYDIDESPEAIKNEFEMLKRAEKDHNTSVVLCARRYIKELKTAVGE